MSNFHLEKTDLEKWLQVQMIQIDQRAFFSLGMLLSYQHKQFFLYLWLEFMHRRFMCQQIVFVKVC